MMFLLKCYSVDDWTYFNTNVRASILNDQTVVDAIEQEQTDVDAIEMKQE